MTGRFFRTLVIAIGVIAFGVPVFPASATVEKELQIESEPTGAEVFLGQGRREVPLGTTPLVHTVAFHSEISVIRMIFKKKGHKPLTMKVSAGQDKVAARLEPLSLTAEPEIHNDAYLHDLQKQLNPILNRAVPTLLEEEARQDFDLAGPIKVAGARGNAFLVLPIVIGDLDIEVRGEPNVRQQKLLKAIWKRLGATIAIPVAREIRDHGGVQGIILDTRFKETAYIHEVAPTVKTRVEMECVPGTRSQMVMQMQQVPYYRNDTWNGVTRSVFAGYRTESKLVPQEVYDPCLYRKPVTKSSVEFDPKARMAKDQGRALFLLPFAVLDSKAGPEALYEELSVLLPDSKGKQLRSQGEITIPSL